MARMIPSPLPDDVPSEAERLLYRKFEAELPADWTVLCGARWIGRRGRLEGQDGEADFVLLHPTEGILVLEAKGGAIELDGRRGVWIQRRGREERILKQSPLAQAEDSKHALLRILRGMRALASRELHLVHAIALPHVQVPGEGLGPDAPRARLMDANDLQQPLTWVRAALRSADRRRPDKLPLGKDGVEWIVDAVAVRRTLNVHTPTLAATAGEKLARLTQQQFDLLNTLSVIPRARVTGGPGTGKTLLALETARRFGAQGMNTLLLCFNAPLGGHLAEATFDTPGVTATHFHAFCRTLAHEAGLDAKLRAAETAEGYEHAFPEILLEAAEALDRRYDALVVDEAQDFRETWWAALEGCLAAGPEAPLYLFEDADQVFSTNPSPVRPGDLQGPFQLTKNCRNSDEIHAFLAACPEGPKGCRSSGVSTGIRPRLLDVDDAGKLPRTVSATVAHLIKEWSVPASEIVVLTPRSPKTSALGKVERLGPAPVSWRERESDRHVLIDTVYRFKGLEATAVVLAEIRADAKPDPHTHLLVGASRATIHLDLLAGADVVDLLGQALLTMDTPDRH